MSIPPRVWTRSAYTPGRGAVKTTRASKGLVERSALAIGCPFQSTSIASGTRCPGTRSEGPATAKNVALSPAESDTR